MDFASLLDTIYVASTEGPRFADSIRMMMPLSEDFRSKYSCRSVETPRGGRDPSVIASVTEWSRFRIVLCWMYRVFGAIVDVVFAIPALLSDGIGVLFPGRWDYLYLNPYSKDVCHIPGINK